MKKTIVWQTEDGKYFSKAKDAAEHAGWSKCPKCDNNGVETYIETISYPRGLPDSAWSTDTKIERRRECIYCKGIGYIKELPINPEYQKYLELKEKYEK